MFFSDRLAKSHQESEPDDQIYDFSGATLKISDDEEQTHANLVKNQSQNKMEQSAILTGADLESVSSFEKRLYKDVAEKEENNYQGQIKIDDDENRAPPMSGKANAGDPPSIFFSFRSGQFENAVTDIINKILRPSNDVNILGSWLLTEISHWDHEHERIFILTAKSFLEVKYDFIGLTILKYNKISLDQINVVLRGKLTYPQKSLVPKLEGITNGIASLFYTSLFPSAANRKRRQQQLLSSSEPSLAVSKRFDFSSFHPVERKDLGIRILWNQGKNLSIFDSWNPIAEIPWKTIKDHPLYAYNDSTQSVAERAEFDEIRYRYSFDSLYNALVGVFSTSNHTSMNRECDFKDGPILMENYIGIGAIIHNKNNLGFFKCRGKFSF